MFFISKNHISKKSCTTKKKKNILAFLIFLTFIVLFSFFPSSILAFPFLKVQTTHEIKFVNYNDLPKVWIETQPVIQRYDFDISLSPSHPWLYYNFEACNDVISILKGYDISITRSHIYDAKPAFNSLYDKYMFWHLKNPPANLLKIFIVPKKTPFPQIQLNCDNKYSLEDLLTYHKQIEKIFIFWKKNN